MIILCIVRACYLIIIYVKSVFNAHMLYVDLIIMMDDVLPSLRLGKFSDCAARHQYEKQEYRENDV